MSEDGVKKSSNPWVALTTGCISGGIEAVSGALNNIVMRS